MAAVLPTMIMAAVFILVAMAFFLSIGKPPLSTLTDMVMFAVGDTYSLSETLVKTAPILLCAFLVAWLSRHNAFVAIMVSFLIGGLIAARGLASALRQGARSERHHSSRPFVRHGACRRRPVAAMEGFPWMIRIF
jgi:ABC-type uncharacterized transport system permease subunit